ncbi:MAG: hypothetical protein JSS98_06150 [Bacteroidetes bacterium]|nr:hypothetical protein [Bacteroidota bacterium]
MDCKCKCWKDKPITLSCYKCGGLVDYIKVQSIKENDSKEIKLQKLQKELQEKQADVIILRTEIKEIQNEIDDLK